MDVKEIRKLAKSMGWIEEETKDKTLLIFNRLQENIHQQINIWFTRMTVGTCLKHPKKGKTQLFRKNVDDKLLRKIFENPRVHTGNGYYTK